GPAQRFATHGPFCVQGLLSMSVQSPSVWQQFGLGTSWQRPFKHAVSVHSEPGPVSPMQVATVTHGWQSGSGGVATHPFCALQESVVHGSLSLQVIATWSHVLLALQVSAVQALPSPQSPSTVQQPVVWSKMQVPVSGLQLSTVQRSLSLQTTGAVGCRQIP